MCKYYFLTAIIILSACSSEEELYKKELYKNSSDQSYYVPGYITVNIHTGQAPNNAVLNYGALSEDIIVLSDLGYSIDYINKDGTTKWRALTPGRGRGLHKWDANTISYTVNNDVIQLDINTGEEINRFNPLNLPLTDFKKVDSGYIAAINNTGGNTVVLLDEFMNTTWSNPVSAQYPRSVEKIGDIVIVADTFGHRIYGIDITTNELVFIEDEYFPNLVEQTDQGLLVVGEHSNRVYFLNTDDGARAEIYACQAEPFGDIYITSEDIQILEQDETHPLLLDPSKPLKSKSICSMDLYSPNGASISNSGTYFIASTDDGIVFEIDSASNIVAELTGFNNPANVIPSIN